MAARTQNEAVPEWWLVEPPIVLECISGRAELDTLALDQGVLRVVPLVHRDRRTMSSGTAEVKCLVCS